MTTESAGENGGGNRKNPRPEVQLYRPGITRLSRSEHEAQQEKRSNFFLKIAMFIIDYNLKSVLCSLKYELPISSIITLKVF